MYAEGPQGRRASVRLREADRLCYAAVVQNWLNEIERVLLLLRLWPRLRAKHGGLRGGAMTEYVKTILTGQFGASLAMLNQCVRLCRPELWEGTIANRTFRRIAYHTLFFVDLYLSPREAAFELRDLHRRGGWTEPDEEAPRIGLPKDDTLGYVEICRAKLLETMASETATSLEGPSGFSWLPISRGELHLYNIRHIQHHTGQMSAYLRRVDPALKDTTALEWVNTGWPKDA